MWEKLNFRQSPFDVKPLEVRKEDVELLMGRDEEQVKFLTAIDSAKEGVFVLSGVPGVGKTSFLNVQQYLLESGEAFVGPRLLSARQLTSIQPSDEPRDIAIRSISSLCKSICLHCEMTSTEIPSETKKIISWLTQNKPVTISGGASAFGFGVEGSMETHISSLNDITYDGLVDILEALSNEVIEKLNVKGSFIVLDNMENLHPDDLGAVLITFRDTLFSLKNVWWVLIGQRGLNSMIQAMDPRVAQRISSHIDLKGISVNNLIKAVDARAVKFHNTKTAGQSPISKSIYTKLFESSNGEIRFVFKYCNDICVELVRTVHAYIIREKIPLDDDSFQQQMGSYLLKKRLDDIHADQFLKGIIQEDIEGLHLSQIEKGVLKKIGEMKSVRPSDFGEFRKIGVKSKQDFTNKYISALVGHDLILRKQQGKVITYELRGIALFALEYELLD